MASRAVALLAKRPLALRNITAVGTRSASSVAQFESPTAEPTTPPSHPHHRQNRPEYLLKYKHYHTVKEAVHYTSYFLAAGVPLTLALGAPVSSFLDWGFAFAIPLHMHVGMRAVLLDYAHFWMGAGSQRIAYAILAAITGLSAFGIVKFNLTDVGLSEAIRQLYVKQNPPAITDKKAGVRNPF